MLSNQMFLAKRARRVMRAAEEESFRQQDSISGHHLSSSLLTFTSSRKRQKARTTRTVAVGVTDFPSRVARAYPHTHTHFPTAPASFNGMLRSAKGGPCRAVRMACHGKIR